MKIRPSAAQFTYFQNKKQLEEQQEKIVQEVKKKIKEAEQYDTGDEADDRISD